VNFFRWPIRLCIFLVLWGCIFDNQWNINHKNQQNTKNLDSTTCQISTFSDDNCLTLPYYSDKNATIELFTFILHGEDRASFTETHQDKMQMVYRPATWRSAYIFQVVFFDNKNFVKICPDNKSDWFGSKQFFLTMLKQKYLNVAGKG